MDVIDKKIIDCERRIQFKQKQVHPVYNKVNLIEDGVEALEKRMTTQTNDRQTEKNLIVEIAKIKASRPILVEIDEIRKEKDGLRGERKKVMEGFPQNDQILKAIRSEIDRLKGQERDMNSQTSVFSDKLGEIKESRL
jgi:predicted  nucleic acid-binding Zn-ribbon protein